VFDNSALLASLEIQAELPPLGSRWKTGAQHLFGHHRSKQHGPKKRERQRQQRWFFLWA